MRVAPPVGLSPEERAYLAAWSRGGARRSDRALRARIVLLAAEGRTDLAIGQELGIDRLTAARWRHRFLEYRLPALDLAPTRLRRTSPVSEDQTRAIVQSARAGGSRGRPLASTRSVGSEIGVSHSTVRRIWAAHGVRPRRSERWPHHPDPLPASVPVDVLGLFLRPTFRAIAFLLARSPPEATDAPLLAGVPPELHRALRPLLDLPPDETAKPPARATVDFLRFLSATSRAVGALGEVRVVASPAWSPRPIGLARWSARNPRVQLDMVPDPEAWLPRVMPLLYTVGKGLRGPDRFASRGELARAIRLFLASYRAETGPFQWVASPREVRRGESSASLRHALSVTGHTGFARDGRGPTGMAALGSPDPRAPEMARVVLGKCLRLRKGERVTIETWSGPVQFANAFVLEALRIGARPLLLYQDEPTYWAAASQVPARNLAHLGEQTRAALERSDVFVSFFGPSDRNRFHALPRVTRNRLSQYRDELLEAAENAGSRAVQLALGRASEASARMYGVDLERWRNEVIDGTLIDPERLHRRATGLAERLRVGREVRIRHPNGTDLTLGLRRRAPQVSDGRVTGRRKKGSWDVVQLPAGVVTVALDERVADGVFASNVPNSVGVMDTIGDMAGGRWTFANGRLGRYVYDRGGELFAQSYDRAGPGRDRPGTLSIGLNERLEISPLLMDQALGTLTLQIGRNATAGGATGLYWWAWLILRGADLSIDDERVVRSGKLSG